MVIFTMVTVFLLFAKPLQLKLDSFLFISQSVLKQLSLFCILSVNLPEMR